MQKSKVEIPCSYCGKLNWVIPCHIKLYKEHFCDKVCHGLWKSKVNTGSGNPNYRGGFWTLCSGCETPTWVKPSRSGNERHFCSKKCASAYLTTICGPISANWKGGLVNKICETCGGDFSVKIAEAARSAASFCSKTCAGLARHDRVDVICPVCSTEFQVVRSYIAITDTICCSCDCANKAKIKVRTPEEQAAFRINRSMSAQINMTLHGRKQGRHWEDLVGYTVEDLKTHLESLWWDGMCWENWGQADVNNARRWHIDHIIPKSSFLFTDCDDPAFMNCWGLHNLQPLWWMDNLSKGVRMDWTPQESILCSVN